MRKRVATSVKEVFAELAAPGSDGSVIGRVAETANRDRGHDGERPGSGGQPGQRRAAMRLVPCTELYWEFVRTLRCDPRVAQGFIQQVQITREQQRAYMSKHWQEYWIALVEGKPAGFVGSVEGDIRVCTHPDFQRRGVGKFMITELARLFPDAVAKIKIDNPASHALFRSLGYLPRFVIYEHRT